jgi:hypothetical protein
MNQFVLYYIYTWKCHKETRCGAILNKQKCHFFFSFTRSENRRTEQVLLRGGGALYHWEGGGSGERCGSVYSANTVYTCM